MPVLLERGSGNLLLFFPYVVICLLNLLDKFLHPLHVFLGTNKPFLRFLGNIWVKRQI